jgi:hypothetical protein
LKLLFKSKEKPTILRIGPAPNDGTIPPIPVPPTKFKVSGAVFDFNTTEIVEGATVTAYVEPPECCIDGSTSPPTISDEGGLFETAFTPFKPEHTDSTLHSYYAKVYVKAEHSLYKTEIKEAELMHVNRDGDKIYNCGIAFKELND